jgi:hypothetical protein
VDLAGLYDFEGAIDGKLRNAADPGRPGAFNAANSLVLARVGNGLKLTGDDAVSVTDAGCRHMHDAISVAFWLRPGEESPRQVVFHRSTGADPNFNGFELLLEEGRLRWMFAREWPGNCIAIRTQARAPAGEWTHVTVTYDGSARAAGLRVYLDGQLAGVEVLRDRLTKDSAGDGELIHIGERFRDAGLRGGTIDEMWVFGRAITPIEVRQILDGTSLTSLLSSKKRSDAEVAALREYYLSAVDPEMRQAVAALRQARTKWRETMDRVREIPVMEEMAEPRPTFMLARGQYDAPTDPVSRETPSCLPAFPKAVPRNRLGLAQWLTLPDHPLTARVEVNRLWQRFFGRGLVLTAENFGQQGQLPSHPELLDWLARDLIEHNWDIKRFCKQIVLSATYRQDSRASKELRERDADNILLARGPAKRLSAEELRDGALALGGLLRPEIGGPPAKPYEPEAAMWRALNNFLPPYERDKGAGLYRRSLYTFWRRTTPPPRMLVFDSTTREICTARRQLTLTPLQPLVLLNDVQFVEAARALGERMLRQGQTSEERVIWAFVEVTGRQPTTEEAKLLNDLFNEQLECYRKDATLAEKLLKVGDYENDPKLPKDQLAAAAMTASALLNLDASIVLR